METEIQEQTSFRLKDCKEITIDNKDVRRIKILNDVVWEKNKQTETNVTASGSFLAGEYVTLGVEVINPHSNDVINGTAIVERDNGNGYKTVTNITIENNKGIFYTKEECTNLESTQKIKYKVTFNQVDVYLASQKEIEVTISRKTPKLQQYGETAIFPGWKIGAKLDYNGQALSNKTILFGNGDTRNTNNNGIVSITNTSNTSFSMTYSFQGDTIYNPQTIEQQYTIGELSSITVTKSLSQSNESDKQIWNIYSNYATCRNKESRTNTGRTIATNSGTLKTPRKLYINLTNLSNDVNIEKTTIKCNLVHEPGLKSGNYYGGLFEYVDFYLNNNISAKYRYTLNKSYYTYNGRTYYYTPHDVKNINYTWNTSGNTITVEYSKNSGTEEGYVKIYNITVIVQYKPSQKTNFG